MYVFTPEHRKHLSEASKRRTDRKNHSKTRTRRISTPEEKYDIKRSYRETVMIKKSFLPKKMTPAELEKDEKYEKLSNEYNVNITNIYLQEALLGEEITKHNFRDLQYRLIEVLEEEPEEDIEERM